MWETDGFFQFLVLFFKGRRNVLNNILLKSERWSAPLQRSALVATVTPDYQQ